MDAEFTIGNHMECCQSLTFSRSPMTSVQLKSGYAWAMIVSINTSADLALGPGPGSNYLTRPADWRKLQMIGPRYQSARFPWDRKSELPPYSCQLWFQLLPMMVSGSHRES